MRGASAFGKVARVWGSTKSAPRLASPFAVIGDRLLVAGTRSTRTAAVWRASFDRQVCGIEIGIT